MNLDRVYKAISDDLYIFWEYVCKSNGLQTSKVNKDADIRFSDNLFMLIFPDYVEYINSGRKPNSKMPPVDAIVTWARQKGIQTDNGTIWKIRRGIAENGIKPRPILDELFIMAEEEWDKEWASELFNEIINDIIEWFK